MSAAAKSETDPDVVQALYDLEVAKGQRVLAGEKRNIDFNQLERGRVGANSRDEEYLNAWNVQLPSVDFSDEVLEDDLGYGQSHRAQMAERLRENEYTNHSVRDEVSGQSGRTGTRHRGRGHADREYEGDNGHHITANRDDSFAQAGPGVAHQNALRNVGPARRTSRAGHRPSSPARRGRSPTRRAISPVRQGARGGSAIRSRDRWKERSGGSTFEKMLEKASKIVGTGAYGAGSKREGTNVPSKPPGTPPEIRGPVPTPHNSSSATNRHSLMASGPRHPIPPVQPATRTQHPMGQLASPGEFMDNAHKVWTTHGHQGSAFESATPISGVVAGKAEMGSNKGSDECHTPTRTAPITAPPIQKTSVAKAKDEERGKRPGDDDCKSSNHKLLCSQFPQVDPRVVISFLNRSNGNVGDAKAKLEKLQAQHGSDPSSSEGIAMYGSCPPESNDQDERTLIDLADAECSTKSRAMTLATPMETQVGNIMDDDSLIIFQAVPLRPKAAHILDDDSPTRFPTPLLRPTLASRSGNVAESDIDDDIIPTDNELSSLSSRLARVSLSENVPLANDSIRDSKASVANKLASSTSASTQTQVSRAIAETSAAAPKSTTRISFKGSDLTTSIWADENRTVGRPGGHGRHRN